MLEDIMRRHILTLESYTSARDEFSGEAEVYLDANENWKDFSSQGKNRYPDPHTIRLRRMIEKVLGFKVENTVIGNGSDELIDMLIRIFAEPGKDSILIERPTYGEYKVFADGGKSYLFCGVADAAQKGGSIRFPVPAGKQLRDVLNDRPVEVKPMFSLELQPGQARIIEVK